MKKAYNDILTALCIWREARGQSLEAMQGVYWVIHNRVADVRWPDTEAQVILQKYQFSAFNTDDPNAVKWPTPDDAAWLVCCSVVSAPGPDTSKGANHYHSFGKLADFPSWADERKLTAKIGPFRFYRL